MIAKYNRWRQLIPRKRGQKLRAINRRAAEASLSEEWLEATGEIITAMTLKVNTGRQVPPEHPCVLHFLFLSPSGDSATSVT